MTIAIGDIAVARIEEKAGPVFGPEGLIPAWNKKDVEPHMHWLVPGHFDPVSGNLVGSFHSWILKTRHHTILLDTCVGNDKTLPNFPASHRAQGPWLDNLRAAGYRPEDFDIVMCTHLHVDHVGWNTRLENGRWVPTFANARYLFSRADRDYWDPKTGGHSAMAMDETMFTESVLPVIESGQAHLVEGIHEIESGIEIHPAPGHTPGNMVLKTASRGARGLFAGDSLHHPIQIYHPEWNVSVDENPAQAHATRRQLLEECVEHRSLLLPAHFATPHAAYIRREGSAFAPDFAI
jgi:glyoxylase-like metal-dependent hydrolase (beta-lactamase superfamily II)